MHINRALQNQTFFISFFLVVCASEVSRLHQRCWRRLWIFYFTPPRLPPGRSLSPPSSLLPPPSWQEGGGRREEGGGGFQKNPQKKKNQRKLTFPNPHPTHVWGGSFIYFYFYFYFSINLKIKIKTGTKEENF